MTTGRINQVTVLRARPKGRTRQRERGLAPGPRPELVTDRSSRPSAAQAARHLTPPGDPSKSCASRVPSPPISHASETFPQSAGLESAPSVKTTVERPHLSREGCQNAADLQ